MQLSHRKVPMAMHAGRAKTFACCAVRSRHRCLALKTPSALPCTHIQRCSNTQSGLQTLHQHTRAPPTWCPALGAPAIMSFPPGARGRLPDVGYQRGVRRSAAREVKNPLGRPVPSLPPLLPLPCCLCSLCGQLRVRCQRAGAGAHVRQVWRREERGVQVGCAWAALPPRVEL